jgi:toxin ParE1/3/4
LKRSVRLLRRARRDLQEIYDFLSREAPARAEPIVDRLFVAVESLESLAHRGAKPRDPFLRAAGYRFLVEGTHLIFYKVVGRQVRVYRVLHAKRAYRGIL